MNYRALSLILFVGMISCSKDKSADAPQAGIKVTGTFKDVNTLRVVPAELYSSRGKINDVVKTMEFVYMHRLFPSLSFGARPAQVVKTAKGLRRQ